MPEKETSQPADFIRAAVIEELKTGRFTRVQTASRSEPNGLLAHRATRRPSASIGMRRAWRNANLRFDDTNPSRRSGVRRVHHAGYPLAGLRLGDRLFYASDYFERLYIIRRATDPKGKAYVCDDRDEVREYGGR